LSAAVRSGQQDLAILLLSNGYRPDIEKKSPFDIALERRDWDLVDVLFEWGVDPTKADPWIVLDTYQGKLMDRFYDHGLDFTTQNSVTWYFVEKTKNKPAYGWAKRHQTDPGIAYELASALGDAVSEDSAKGVCMLAWAGADPHLKVLSLRWASVNDDPERDGTSAIETAVESGHGKFLRYLKPDPARDNIQGLIDRVIDPEAVDYLMSKCPPGDWSTAIARNIGRMEYFYRDRSTLRQCLKRILEKHDGRLNALDDRECKRLRRDLLKEDLRWDLEWILRLFAKPEHCDPVIYKELTRTPTMKARMVEMGLIEPKPKRGVKR